MLNSSAPSYTWFLEETEPFVFCTQRAGGVAGVVVGLPPPPLPAPAVQSRRPAQLTISEGLKSDCMSYVCQRASTDRFAVISPAGRPKPHRPPPMDAPTLSIFCVNSHEVGVRT